MWSLSKCKSPVRNVFPHMVQNIFLHEETAILSCSLFCINHESINLKNKAHGSRRYANSINRTKDFRFLVRGHQIDHNFLSFQIKAENSLQISILIFTIKSSYEEENRTWIKAEGVRLRVNEIAELL